MVACLDIGTSVFVDIDMHILADGVCELGDAPANGHLSAPANPHEH
jgi:hypothetical protein